MSENFNTIFSTATRNSEPYGYQCRLAKLPCESRLIDIPTGLGKTAAVVLAWLWNRVAHPDATNRNTWPRRLVYCLPMRTLVEQTEGEVRSWIENLVKKGLIASTHESGKPRVVVLMGGETLEGTDNGHPLFGRYRKAQITDTHLLFRLRATATQSSEPPKSGCPQSPSR